MSNSRRQYRYASPWVRLLHISFVVLTALLLIRAAFVESFQLTTGSMAPLLVGVHRKCNCPKCGFPVVVGAPNSDSPPDHYDVKCPNCGQGNLGLDKQPDLPGQRLIVDKTAFEWRNPRRWEVVVFRGPDEKATPYVKRIVGLPGESVQIKDGDVYIDGEIIRRPIEVFKEMSFLIYDGTFPVPARYQLTGPVLQVATGLQFNCVGDTAGEVTMDFPLNAAKHHNDYCVYNGSRTNRIEKERDFWLSCDLKIESIAIRPGHIQIKVLNESREVMADLYALDSNAPTLLDKTRYTINQTRNNELAVGATEHLDIFSYETYDEGFLTRHGFGFSNASQQIFSARSGPGERGPVGDILAPFTITVSNVDVRLENIRIHRDVHYQSAGRHGIAAPYRLGPDEYFVLGDNSAASDDSRFWPTPGVKHGALIGRVIYPRLASGE